jgi:tRNA(adenine34) deaminase
MREALNVARAGMLKGNLPIGAVLVLDDRIIARAHTAEADTGRLLVHAEMLALWDADQLQPFPGKRGDTVLYTNLEPCPMCLGAAMSFFVGAIYYALEAPVDGAVKLIQGWQRDESAMDAYRVPVIHGGLLRQESKALFAEYLAQHRPGGELESWVKTLVDLP